MKQWRLRGRRMTAHVGQISCISNSSSRSIMLTLTSRLTKPGPRLCTMAIKTIHASKRLQITVLSHCSSGWTMNGKISTMRDNWQKNIVEKKPIIVFREFLILCTACSNLNAPFMRYPHVLLMSIASSRRAVTVLSHSASLIISLAY